jgi:hypothetical protein
LESPIVMYFVSLNFDLPCEEDVEENRLMDSFLEWKNLLKEVDSSKLILVFTKNDLYKPNDQKLKQIFPDFDGTTKPIDFIVEKFTQSHKIPHYIISTIVSKEVGEEDFKTNDTNIPSRFPQRFTCAITAKQSQFWQDPRISFYFVQIGHREENIDFS